MVDHHYTWNDIRERLIGELSVGDVMFNADCTSPYLTGGPDGRVTGLSFTLNGAAWTITTRVGELTTVVRHDGQRSQTVRIPDDYKVLAVVNSTVPSGGAR